MDHLFFTFVSMRKVLIVSFLVVYLFSSTQLSELLKIPLLIEHYSEHQMGSEKLSFADFLHMHYVDHENHSDDKDRDLPFQAHSNSEIVHYYLPISPSVYTISTLSISDQTEEKNFHTVDHSLTSSFLSSIWQPPQFV